MALSSDDYKAPTGELEVNVLWPRLDGETESQRDARADEDIEAYRVQAYTKTSDADLTRKWVNYRAWSRFADVLNGIPATASNDEGSRSYLQEQIDYWSTKAAEALADFETETAVEGSEYDTIQSLR